MLVAPLIPVLRTRKGSVGPQLGAATFLIGLRAFFTLVIYLLPWALLVFPLVMLARWLRRGGEKTNA